MQRFNVLQYRHATYGDWARPVPPYTLSVKAKRRNGQPKPAAERDVRRDIERSVRASGVVVPYDGKVAADGEIGFDLDSPTHGTSRLQKVTVVFSPMTTSFS
jgi:hypothetical protein